jgi:raffinose/stachyose/melibiose transport system substrate-binding protein
MTIKSRLAIIAAAGTAAAVLLGASGCSASGTDANTVTFQTNLSVDSKLMAAFTELTAKFAAANPDITVDVLPSGISYESDMKVRLAANNVPDIIATHGWSLLRYSEFLEPLQNEPWAANFNPALDSAMKNADGEFFAFPVDTDVAGIIYNGDVLAAAGIDPADIRTWSQFSAAAAAVKAAGVSPITVSGKDGGPAGNVADWREAGYFNPDYSSATADDMARALANDQTAFVFSQNAVANDALQYSPDANLGFIPVPSATSSTPQLIGGEMNAYGISKTSANIAGAKAYIAFLAEPENASILAEAAGNLPGLTNATAALGALQPSFDTYFDRVYLPNGMWNTMVTTTDSVITGQSDVAGAVRQMGSDFASLWAQTP